MGRKCSVAGCRSGYDKVKENEEKISIYRFPENEEECKDWVSRLPNVLDYKRVTKNMGVCALHFSADTPFVRKNRGRHPVPVLPPSIFPNINKSQIPTGNSTTPRSTVNALSAARNPDVDEMSLFKEQDRLKCDSFREDFKQRYCSFGFIASCDDTFVVLSPERCGNIHLYSMYFTIVKYENKPCVFLQYEAFYKVKKIVHPSVNCSRISCWSQLDELFRFVKNYDSEDEKLKFICSSVKKLNSPKNVHIYSTQDFALAFSWISISRALYSELRTYLPLPSLSTLRKITRVAKNLDDVVLFKSVFDAMDARSRGCILIVDEVYVKASLTYRGGTIFGYAEDCPDKIATTFLCVMVKCFFTFQTFLVKFIPCHALNADFQFIIIKNVLSTLHECGAKVIGLVCDNNRLNQRFFRLFFEPLAVSTPWVVKSPASSDPFFLIYDPVHLMKNLRNNWHSEKTQTITFYHDGVAKQAKWSDLKSLYEQESQSLLKLSSLTKSAVDPNNIQKQKVSLALQVFSEKTSAALRSSSVNTESCEQTAMFIDKVLVLWKVWNCKTRFQHIRHRDPDRASIDDSERGNHQLNTLQTWADMAKTMEPTSSPRVCTLTTDTSKALRWTCLCLIELSRFLLNTDDIIHHNYVSLGFFQQDDIERHFAHFRMSAGNNFYITAQDVMNTHAIDKAKLMLTTECEIDFKASCHTCSLCVKSTTEQELLLIDSLPELIGGGGGGGGEGGNSVITPDEKLSLLYIGGYICNKHKDIACLQGDPSVHPEYLLSYTKDLDRGGLRYPSQPFFQLLGFMFAFFKQNKETCCRKRLFTIYSDFPSIFHLDLVMPPECFHRLINIFMKRFCAHFEGSSNQNKKRKVSKLTSSSL